MYNTFSKKLANLSGKKNIEKSNGNLHDDSGEMKHALRDEKRLKRHRKRLTIDWFFRPKE